MVRSIVTPAHGVIVRESAPGRRQIAGIIPFNSPSVDMGFIEFISPTAFDRTINDAFDVKALVGHDSLRPLARVGNGTLRLVKTVEGLFAECDLPKTSFAEDAWQLIRSGTAPGMSFGFSPITERWVEDEKHKTYNVFLDDVVLYEISFCVVFPAYAGTDSEAFGD